MIVFFQLKKNSSKIHQFSFQSNQSINMIVTIVDHPLTSTTIVIVVSQVNSINDNKFIM